MTTHLTSSLVAPALGLDSLGEAAHQNNVENRRLRSRCQPGGSVLETDAAILCDAGIAFAFANAAFRADPHVPPSTVIDQAEDFFAGRGHGYGLMIRTGHGGEDDFAGYATDNGFASLVSLPSMARTEPVAEPSLPAGFRATIASTPDDLAAFARVWRSANAAAGYPAPFVEQEFARPEAWLQPHVLTVVAYDRAGSPVAGGMVLASQRVAGIYSVATVPEARGCGLGEAVSAMLTNLGFQLGARAVTLQASSMAEGIYRRLGYQDVGGYQVFARLPR